METSNNGEGNEVGKKEGFLRGEVTEKYDRMSVSGWQKWIGANIENFKGNRENAALLMKGFAEGIDYVQKKSKLGIVGDFNDPIIKITDDNNPDLPNFECVEDGKIIKIKKTFLEKASSFDINSTRTAKSKNDEITFIGTTQDMFLLAAIEEGCHSSDLQNNSSDLWNNSNITNNN